MLKVFRKNQFLRSLLLWPIAAALNLNLLFGTAAFLPDYHPIIDPWFGALYEDLPVLYWLIFASLLFIAAILLNRIVIINRLSNEITLYPGLFFILIASVFPVFDGVTTITICLLFLLLILANVMYANPRNKGIDKIFNCGLYVGLMTLLFAPQIIFVLLAIIAVNLLSQLRWRSILNLFNGLLLPLYLLVLYLVFFHKDLQSVVDLHAQQFGLANLSPPETLPDGISLAVLALFLIFMLISHGNTIAKKPPTSIRKINILAWTAFFAVVIFLLSGIKSMHLLVLVTPVLGFYLAEGVLRFKKDSNGELIFILLIFLSIVLPLMHL